MALLTPLFAFLYHLPQVYKWLLKPYYVASLFMSIAFLAVRKTPGICDHLSTQREDGNSCDFDWVCGHHLQQQLQLLNNCQLAPAKTAASASAMTGRLTACAAGGAAS